MPANSLSASANRLPRRFKILYSMGDFATAMPLTIVTFYQLFFMINIAGLSAGKAGLAVLIGKIWDAVNDPLFGIYSDRISSPRGRRRGVIFFTFIPFGLSFIALFFAPNIGDWAKVIYFTLAIIVFDTIYTMVSVSYNALTPVVTQDYDERSSLNGYRMAYSIFGGLFGIVLFTILGGFIRDQRSLYATSALIIGLLAILPLFVVYRVTEPYDDDSPVEDALPPMSALKETLGNRPFWWLMGLYLFSWTAASVVGSVFIFYANYYLRVPDQANFFILVSQVSGILFIPIMVWASGKLDKRRAFMLGSFLWIINSVLIYFVRPDQPNLIYLLAFTGGVGVATAYFLPWAMIPDVVELDELKTGQRREGSFYAFAAFFQKLGTGLVVWLFGMILGARGFVEPPDNATIEQVNAIVQPQSAVDWIQFSLSILPALLLVASIICAYFYPITRKSHEDVLEQLATQG